MESWDFDGDEVLFFAVAFILGVVGLIQWYGPLARQTGLGQGARGHAMRELLGITPIAAMGGLLIVLMHWSDPKYVAGHIDYILLFLSGGLAWLMFARVMARWLGVDLRDDAVERRNPAAAIALCGTLLGAMAIYAGGNVGAGPTIWTTIWPALLATAAWAALWLIVELITRVSEQIAVERDVAAGLRHAGWLIAGGLVLGRAIAGDWSSWESTHADLLRLGSPALLLTAAIVPLHWRFRATPRQPRPSAFRAGAVPALVMILMAVAYLLALGPADIGKHVITYEQYMGQRR